MIGIVEPGAGSGLGRAEGHVVVGGDDGVDVRVGLERLLGDGQSLVAREVRRLLEDDLVLGVVGDARS